MGLKIKTGEKAPDFRLRDKDGREAGLSDFLGQWVVLYFYPKDNTPGCTQEAISFSERLPDFEKEGAVVIGISPDSEASHARFAEKHALKVKLLSDPEHKVLERYGVWQAKKLYGREFMGVVRSTILINPEGAIEKIWEKVKVKDHAVQVKDTLCSIK